MPMRSNASSGPVRLAAVPGDARRRGAAARILPTPAGTCRTAASARRPPSQSTPLRTMRFPRATADETAPAFGADTRRERRVLNVAAFGHTAVRASNAAPTRKVEYGAYARSIAANARSRNTVSIRSSPGAFNLCPLAALRPPCERPTNCGRNDVPAAAETDAEPLGNARAEIGKRRATSERDRTHHAPEGEQWDTFACVIGRRGCRVVSVVGGNEEQIVLAK